jgi:hypothetical protein
MKLVVQLREIQRIISNFGDKSSKSLFLPNKKNTQLRLLARKIASHEAFEEQEWAKKICNTGENDQTYIRLRSQLNRRMVGLLFHLDIRKGAAIRKAIYNSARDMFCIRILVMFGARTVAMRYVPRALERARKYELTQDRIELLLFLRRDATLNGDCAKFAHCASELDEAEGIRAAEMKMQRMNEEISVELTVRVNPNEKVKALAILSVPEASVLFKRHQTFNIGLNYFRIATLASQIAEDSRKTLELCNQAEQFLNRFPRLVSPLYIGQFALTRMNSAFSEGHYETALTAKSACETAFPEGNNNWFIWKEIEFLICMHTNRFSNAMSIHHQIVHHARFPSQTEQVREKWTLFGHYVQLALWKELSIEASGRQKAFEKILSEVPIYKRDKAGYNASLLILQQLIYASASDKDGMIQKADALKRYISRNLRGRRDTRLYAFMKMLLILQKYDFNAEVILKRSKGYIEKFKYNDHKKIDETQTLPFSLMWEWIWEWVNTSTKFREV